MSQKKHTHTHALQILSHLQEALEVLRTAPSHVKLTVCRPRDEQYRKLSPPAEPPKPPQRSLPNNLPLEPLSPIQTHFSGVCISLYLYFFVKLLAKTKRMIDALHRNIEKTNVELRPRSNCCSQHLMLFLIQIRYSKPQYAEHI